MLKHLRRPNLRRNIAAVAVLCLLWHVLMPVLANLGFYALPYAMSPHCTIATSSTPMSMDVSNTATMHLPSAAISTSQDRHDQLLLTKADHMHAVLVLASKIMQHCPLCSHGLDGGLLPMLAICWLLLFLLCRIVYLPVTVFAFIYRPLRLSFFKPQPHAPPLAF